MNFKISYDLCIQRSPLSGHKIICPTTFDRLSVFHEERALTVSFVCFKTSNVAFSVRKIKCTKSFFLVLFEVSFIF